MRLLKNDSDFAAFLETECGWVPSDGMRRGPYAPNQYPCYAFVEQDNLPAFLYTSDVEMMARELRKADMEPWITALSTPP